MKLLLRYLLLLAVLFFVQDTVLAQSSDWQEIHKVKRKETIFGIAKSYGLTVDELVKANPEMSRPGYTLKKGDYIFIPYPSSQKTSASVVKQEASSIKQESTSAVTEVDMRRRAIRVGIMLPLHDENGDGRRMVEYYRGVLMACDSLKQLGVSVDVYAWNVAEDANINKVLKDHNAAKCDLIIGPLYSKQVKALSEFATEHNIKVLIPFSINSSELFTNSNIYQVYQSPYDFNDAVIEQYLERFAGCHTVFIDCNDSTSKKGNFTLGLRRRLESLDRTYSITNVKSKEANFTKAFSTTKPNVVVLNTGRSPELNLALARLNNLTMNNPNLSVSMFGYTEWMMYTKYNLDNYYKYNVYIPAAFYYNPLSSRTERIEQKYRWNFHADMMQALPRFAITGFDHAFYFIKGMNMYGEKFHGAPGMVGYTPIQTALRFYKIANGGYKNQSIVFVHYTPGHKVETLQF